MNVEQLSMTYAGTAGHSGTDTSKAQAEDRKRVGKTQTAVMQALALAGRQGRTVAELRAAFPFMHHGQISSALTNLHRDKRIARLTEKRGKAKVYVVMGAVDGRTTEEPTNPRSRVTECPHCGGDL